MKNINTIPPYNQAIISLVIGGIFMLFAKFMSEQPSKPWILAATFGLFFTAANCVYSLSAKDTEKYWTQSMLSFVGLMLALSGFAYLLSGVGLRESTTIRWIMIVIVIGYLVFVSIVRMMRSLVEFAEREEWHQPKERKRTRK